MSSAPSAPPLHCTPRLSVSAVVPARDEQGSIAQVVSELLALRWPDGQRVVDEVIVADNGSKDDTARLARQAGATVVPVARAGYGRACWHGAQAARGQTLLFVDGDGAALTHQALWLLSTTNAGAAMAIGHRTAPEPGAMSWTQRFGNAFACLLMRRLWDMPDRDLGPFRAIHRAAYRLLDLQDRGFGWTVEMQVRAHRMGMHTVHVPVSWRARTSGRSKVGGSLPGAVRAGLAILGVIGSVWLRERRRPPSPSAFTQPKKEPK